MKYLILLSLILFVLGCNNDKEVKMCKHIPDLNNVQDMCDIDPSPSVCDEPCEDQYYQSQPFRVGDCFVEKGKDGGYYKIVGEGPHSWIARPYGKYAEHGTKIPSIFSKEDSYLHIDCFEGRFKDNYMKHVKEE
jgi:hypothetical protein